MKQQNQQTPYAQGEGNNAVQTMTRRVYQRPTIISYREKDILRELGPAKANGSFMEDELNWDGLNPIGPGF